MAHVFDDMLARSIPQYQTIRDLTSDMVVKLARSGTTIVDLGCATGSGLAAWRSKLRQKGTFTFLGADVSEPMLERAREQFPKQNEDVWITYCDLRSSYPIEAMGVVSVAVSFLTLQFIPIEHRYSLLKRVINSLQPGGAFLLVEKVIGENPEVDELFSLLYYQMKRANGYSDEDIDRKKLSLEGVLVPKTPRENEVMLERVGFVDVACYWRWCNFAAWVAYKPNAKG